MRAKLMDRLGKEWMFFDGGMGTLLQAKGLAGGELPETWNLSHPDDIRELHMAYLQAGCDIFNTNTFGANRLKYPDNLEEIVTAAVRLAKEARTRAGREDAYIALDIGPTGKLLAPMGDLPFEEAVRLFGETVRIGAAAGADLVLIETMSDSYEAKAAVLAAKENCDLPVLVTTIYDGTGKLLTGGTVASVVPMLEGLGVDALGVNCGLGPEQMIPIVKELVQMASVPILVNPNAGLPRTDDEGRTVYDVGPADFAGWMGEIAALGVQAVGGCCGTTPEHIRRTIAVVSRLPFRANTAKHRTVVTSFSRAVEIGPRPVIVGERINPTGKKKFKEALRSHDLDYLCGQALEQEDAGADILDVNVGLPEIDEAAMMEDVIPQLQSITPLPLQIDTTNPEALERALRCYNGKPMVNSVNGKQDQIETVLPLVKKYGGVLIGLPIDESGIPADADGRIRVARKIYAAAEEYGIPAEDIVIDGLAMTVSSDSTSAETTLETIRRVRDELHGHSVLGVSNISFGLPQRPMINAFFFTMAMEEGLSCAIVNPNSDVMMAAFRTFLLLSGRDAKCLGYLTAYADRGPVVMGKAPAIAGSGSAGPAGVQTGTAGGSGSQAGVRAVAAGGSGSSAGAQGVEAGGTQSGAAAAAGDAAGQQVSDGAAHQNGVASALAEAVRRGIAGRAAEETRNAVAAGVDPMDLINHDLIPALDLVGQGFEKGTLFLPQLLMAAEAAKASFAVIKDAMSGTPRETKGKIILATVKGDIHDIGKNIVKVMLENYGYQIIDLGKDVAPETIVDTAIREQVKLVGLSALMTTTVVSMEETIRLLREKKPDTRVMVGGAVMTQEYADKIGADAYAKDAMGAVRYADTLDLR